MSGKTKTVKLLSVLLAFVMLLGVMPMGSLIASAETEGLFMYNVKDEKATIITCQNDASGDIVIPETLGGYPVEAISVYSFSDCDKITSVTMPDSVKTIGVGAFADCEKLAVVKIGAGVISIGSGAFTDCGSLAKIEVSSANTVYKSDENGALYTYDKTDLLVYPTSNTATTFVVASEVEEIKDNAFAGSQNAKTIILGDNVKSIGKNAFLGSRSLEMVMIGSAVTSIGNDAFEGCEKLAGISVHVNNPVLHSDEAGVLYSKDKKQLIKYPNGKSSVSYTVADETEVINVLAFANTKALTEITIGKNVKEIGASAFIGCDLISKVNYGGSAAEWKNVKIGANNEKLLSAAFNFAGGVEHTHTYTSVPAKNATCTETGVMSYSCECGHNYTETIPALGHNFANNTCQNCSMKEFVLASDGTRAKITKYNGSAAYLTIPATIEGYEIIAIGDNVFEGKTSIVSIVIPAGVKEIGSCAFYKTGYYNNSANWENGVLYIGKFLIEANDEVVKGNYTVKEGTEVIADYAFSACTSLTGITFPASVKVIGDAAFSNCTGLKDVNCGVRKAEWANVTIGTENSALLNATFTFVPDPHVHSYDEIVDELKVTCLEAGYKITKCSCGDTKREDYPAPGHIFVNNVCTGCGGREYDISISNNEVTIIGCHESLSGNIVLPSAIGGYSVAKIGANAFAGNKNITGIVIPSTVTEIGEKAFFNCDELVNISIPASVTAMGSLAFADCAKLSALSVSADNAKFTTDENGVLFNKVKTEILYYPTGKASVTYEIPDGVMVIGKNAFNGYASLVTVTIPASVKTVDEGAFDGCEGLKKVNFTGTETKWNRVIIRDKNAPLTKAEKTFADLSDAEKALVVSKLLMVYNADVSTKGINIILTESDKTVGIMAVDMLAKDGETEVSIETDGTLIEVYEDGTYNLLISDWHLSGNKTETTVTIGEDTFPIIFIFEPENDGHDFSIVEELEPTCVDKGCTRYTCSICGAYRDENEVDALGHEYGLWIIDSDEGCVTEGKKYRECTVCDEFTEGHIEWGVVRPTGHDYIVAVTEPTCHEGGYTAYFCQKCGHYYETDFVPAAGHKYGEWSVITEASCTTAGEKIKECTVCEETADGHFVKEVVDALGHNYVSDVTPPTEFDEGYTTHICTQCGDTYKDTFVPAIGKVKSVVLQSITLNKDEVKALAPKIDVTPGVQYSVVYESADESIATVDSDGKVTAVSRGITTITCTVTDQYGNKESAECTVEVKFTVIQWITWFFVDFLFSWIGKLF